MLQRYERGNENFTSGESYRKSNKVRLQVRRTEWNITPHNQRLPDQYSSHRRDRLPGFVLLPSVCLSKWEENWNPCSSSYCTQLISRTPYGGVVLAAGGFAPPTRRTSHIREIKKSARFRRGVPNVPTALKSAILSPWHRSWTTFQPFFFWGKLHTSAYTTSYF